MSQAKINYTVIDLGDGVFDLRPEPTYFRFTSRGAAQQFVDNLIKMPTTGEVKQIKLSGAKNITLGDPLNTK